MRDAVRAVAVGLALALAADVTQSEPIPYPQRDAVATLGGDGRFAAGPDKDAVLWRIDAALKVRARATEVRAPAELPAPAHGLAALLEAHAVTIAATPAGVRVVAQRYGSPEPAREYLLAPDGRWQTLDARAPVQWDWEGPRRAPIEALDRRYPGPPVVVEAGCARYWVDPERSASALIEVELTAGGVGTLALSGRGEVARLIEHFVPRSAWPSALSASRRAPCSGAARVTLLVLPRSDANYRDPKNHRLIAYRLGAWE